MMEASEASVRQVSVPPPASRLSLPTTPSLELSVSGPWLHHGDYRHARGIALGGWDGSDFSRRLPMSMFISVVRDGPSRRTTPAIDAVTD